MRRLCRAALTLLFVPALASAQKRPITDRDLFAFQWIGDEQVSPDGHSAVFVQASVIPDHSGYQTSLYLLDLTQPGATPQQLTPGTHDQSPRWSPDGSQIAFVRSAERPGAAGPPSPAQVYLMPAKVDGPVMKLTDLPKGAGSPLWTPDGKALVVTSSTPQDQPKAKTEAAKLARSTGDDAHVPDIRIINRASYRFNGEGYLDPTFAPQLYMVYLPDSAGTQAPPWQLTGGRYGAQDAFLAPNGWLFYSSSHVDEPVYEEFPHNTLSGMAVTSAAIHPKEMPTAAFTQDLKHEARGLAISPDCKHIAFHAQAEGAHAISHQQTDLWVLDLNWSGSTPSAPTEARNLTGGLAYEMGSGVGGDNTAPRGAGRDALTWSADSSHVLDIAGHRGSALLVSVDTTKPNAVAELTAAKQAVLGFSASKNGEHLVALISNPIVIGDLYALGLNAAEAKTQTQLTQVNDKLFSQLDLQMPLDLEVTPTVRAADLHGEKIDTFIQLPPSVHDGSKPASPLPTILNIHGGPHSAYGWVFDHEMLLMAARGYVVIYPNPRGSTTYGQNFANIIMNNYPGNDFHDLMDTVDAAIKAGYADRSKLGVTGGSGGGLLTDWVVTQTNRFKAAVAQRDITDWANWWYTADAAGFHQSFYPKSPPFDNVELYRAHSPITFVNNIKTPMMFILGEADFRTPPTSGGEDFFRALKYKHIPTVMVRFPRESHELSRSGEPWHRVERLDNIIDWFDEFLMGKCEPQYDIAPTCNVASPQMQVAQE